MKPNNLFAVSTALLLTSSGAFAQFSINAISGFSPNGDGWLAPAEGGYGFLGIANTERGLAYGNGHLYLVSRAGGSFVRILNPSTGADLGALSTTGISGGTFAVNMAGVGGDGAIYVGNLTTQASTSPYKVYRWANEAATPTTAYSGAALQGARVGDTFDVFGSGSATRIAAGFGNSPATNNNNGYAIINPTAGTGTNVTFTGTPPNAGDFRLGITFGANATTVMGTQGGATTSTRLTSYDSSSFAGSLTASLTLSSIAERLMDYTVINGVPVVATISTGDSTVRVWDITDPTSPKLLGSRNNTTGALTANSNGTGAVAWGDIVNNPDGTASANLWTLSSNQGIQALVVTVPEPGALALGAAGLALAAAFRRRSRK